MTEVEKVEPKVFQCSLCPFYAAYDRYDSTYANDPSRPSTSSTQNMKNKKKERPVTVELLEDVYLLRDPFVVVKDKEKEEQTTSSSSLILGSTCSVCSRPVCVHSDCSIFYTRRFCLKCVAQYQHEFPRELLDEIGSKRLDKFNHVDDQHDYYDDGT